MHNRGLWCGEPWRDASGVRRYRYTCHSRGRLRFRCKFSIFGDGGLVDAVHDVDLQGVQVGQDLVALGAGVLRNVPLLLPVGTWEPQKWDT